MSRAKALAELSRGTVANTAPYPYQAIFDAIAAAVDVEDDGTIRISVAEFLVTFRDHRDRDLASEALLIGPTLIECLPGLCDCQHPETTADGYAAVSVNCPIHGDRK